MRRVGVVYILKFILCTMYYVYFTTSFKFHHSTRKSLNFVAVNLWDSDPVLNSTLNLVLFGLSILKGQNLEGEE